MKKLLIIAMAASTLGLAACNTIHGAARDVQSVTECADGRPNNC